MENVSSPQIHQQPQMAADILATVAHLSLESHSPRQDLQPAPGSQNFDLSLEQPSSEQQILVPFEEPLQGLSEDQFIVAPPPEQPLQEPQDPPRDQTETLTLMSLEQDLPVPAPVPDPVPALAAVTANLPQSQQGSDSPRRPRPQPLPEQDQTISRSHNSRHSQHSIRPSPSSGRNRGGQSKGHLLAEIPSSTDFYAPAGPSSASPSSWSIASSDTAPSVNSSVIESRVRFERLPNGGHRHHLSAPKRQQFLANQVRRLRELLDGKREKDEIHHPPHGHHLKPENLEHPLSLLNEKCQDMDNEPSGSPMGSRKKYTVKGDFVHKYGELQQIVGKGAFGTVRVSIKRNADTGEETVFAIKEFKYDYGESQKTYMRRLTSEFCIASSLKHRNVIETMDLLQLHTDTYSEVMEYCAGGDMHSLIASANTLGESESSCFFSQLLNGVSFLHSMGVVHRDLKPENLLLTSDGCLKIADFGNSEVFRMPWEKKVRSSASIRGSGPFISPEEFTTRTFDARKVDMWACGIIYMCMRLGRYNWHEASDGDPIWDGFLYRRERFLQMGNGQAAEEEASHVPTHINLTSLEQSAHITLGWPSYIADVIENLLEPSTKKRWQATQVLDSEWLQHIDNCHPSERPPAQELDETEFADTPSSQRVGSKVVQEDAVTGCGIVKEVRQHRRDAQDPNEVTNLAP